MENGGFGWKIHRVFMLTIFREKKIQDACRVILNMSFCTNVLVGLAVELTICSLCLLCQLINYQCDVAVVFFHSVLHKYLWLFAVRIFQPELL